MDIKVVLGENQKVEAHYKGFVIQTDQSKSSGGDGSFPSPFDLFLASVATCAGYYVKSFCQQRDISEEGIQVVQTMHRNSETRMIENIDIEIGLPDSFPEKYRQSIIKAAEACSVKKHIVQGPAFSVTTKTL
ncbi:MAG: OsmC family protein [Bacteroidales bacterium]